MVDYICASWLISPPHRANALNTQDWVLTKLNNKLVAAGINLPFPIQQILFHERTEKTDGDRSNGNYN